MGRNRPGLSRQGIVKTSKAGITQHKLVKTTTKSKLKESNASIINASRQHPEPARPDDEAAFMEGIDEFDVDGFGGGEWEDVYDGSEALEAVRGTRRFVTYP